MLVSVFVGAEFDASRMLVRAREAVRCDASPATQRRVERVLKIRIGIFVHLSSPVFALRQQQPIHGEPPFGPTFSWQNQSGTQSFRNLQNVALGIRQVRSAEAAPQECTGN
jgi:hypothetical protein